MVPSVHRNFVQRDLIVLSIPIVFGLIVFLSRRARALFVSRAASWIASSDFVTSLEYHQYPSIHQRNKRRRLAIIRLSPRLVEAAWERFTKPSTREGAQWLSR